MKGIFFVGNWLQGCWLKAQDSLVCLEVKVPCISEQEEERTLFC